MDPFTKQPHSAQYKNLLATRQKLPLYKEMEGFMRMVSPMPRLRISSRTPLVYGAPNHLIVAGEPGSGKTTQYASRSP